MALNWSHRDFPELAPAVRVPVRFTLGRHDNVFRSDPQALAEIADMFSAAACFVSDLQDEAGHNLSLGHSAADYHRKVFAFVQECVELPRRQPTIRRPVDVSHPPASRYRYRYSRTLSRNDPARHPVLKECAMTTSKIVFDPFSEEFFNGPWDTYRRMQEEAPVYYSEEYDFYALTRHADVAAGLKDFQTYSSAYGIDLAMVRTGQPSPHKAIIFMDPPSTATCAACSTRSSRRAPSSRSGRRSSTRSTSTWARLIPMVSTRCRSFPARSRSK
ncbi:hypothetical protein NIIDMKKI_08220 [Mycobacterium kansasii]|uniref:Uncharacterized protein n=1 Tax=Mycobacterium kansasii TaxID=1768 RepID=A0A7G1I3P0_MYCKA|nr:hypothetical protein NIIDMKKI_08220 [Mycobacterium kansasii]